jgi:hypothetical protein
MKALFPAIRRNDSQHLRRELMARVNVALPGDPTIRAVNITFRLKLPIALRQLIT